MWRCKKTRADGARAGLLVIMAKDGFGESARRTFALGAGDVDDVEGVKVGGLVGSNKYGKRERIGGRDLQFQALFSS